MSVRDPSYDVSYRESPVIRKLYLELTDRCNLDCSFCYRRGWELPAVDMSPEMVARLLRDLESVEGLEKIVLGGIGEPTYHPRFAEIVRQLSGTSLHLTTNGTLLHRANRELLIRHMDAVTVSVDGGPESYMRLRGTDLDRVTGNLEALEREKKAAGSVTPKLEIQFVANTDNIGDIFRVVDLAVRLNASRVILSNLLPQSEDYRDKIVYTRCETPEGRSLINRIQSHALHRGMNIALPPLWLKTERFCRFVEDVAAYITADGHVVPCYRFSHNCREYVFGREKTVSRYSFGALQEESLLSIWNSDRYRRFRYRIHANRYPSCLDCDFEQGCDIPVKLEEDCLGHAPNCSDCLWARRLVVCP